MIDGRKLNGDTNHVQLSKSGVEIKFDIVIRTKKGVLFCCLIKQSQGFKTAAAPTKGGKLMSLEHAHHLFGHSNHRSTIDTATHFGWGQLKNNGKIGQAYAKTKAKQKSTPQSRRETKLTIPNERMYHDLATVKAPADIAEKVLKPNW